MPCWIGWPATQARSVDIDGCVYREGLSAVRIDGGVAGNVIPDAASVTVNFRFAPDRSPDAALATRARGVRRARRAHRADRRRRGRAARAVTARGQGPGARPPAGQVRAKYGWTDVARFAALGIPAVNFGPGDPNLAHRRDERVPVANITAVVAMLRGYLGG